MEVIGRIEVTKLQQWRGFCAVVRDATATEESNSVLEKGLRELSMAFDPAEEYRDCGKPNSAGRSDNPISLEY